jgi:hypothetical protein
MAVHLACKLGVRGHPESRGVVRLWTTGVDTAKLSTLRRGSDDYDGDLAEVGVALG